MRFGAFTAKLAGCLCCGFCRVRRLPKSRKPTLARWSSPHGTDTRFLRCGVRFGLFFGRSSISSRLSHLDGLAADAAAAREFADVGIWLTGEGNEFCALFSFTVWVLQGMGSPSVGAGKVLPMSSHIRKTPPQRGSFWVHQPRSIAERGWLGSRPVSYIAPARTTRSGSIAPICALSFSS